MKKSSHEPPIESPIPFRTGSNGEFDPPPPTKRDRIAEETFQRLVAEKARRLGLSRRDFVSSTMGTATALCVINQVYGCSTNDAGFNVDGGMMLDAGACEALQGDEFIFDVQTHHVNPNGAWREGGGFEGSLATFPQSGCGEMDFVDCFDADHYIRELFVNSDTSVAVLSQVPAVPGDNPLETEEAAATREIVNRLADSERLVIHGIVVPDRGQAQLDGMQALKEEQEIAAWKVYTQFGSWRLDDEAIGIPFIEKARELDVKLICAHKGLSFFGLDPTTTPEDIGVVAPMYPDVSFLVYHSGYELAVEEGPYDPNSQQGVDTLVKAVLDNGIGKQGNVYAELGSTWRFLMTRPTQAAHVLGKLLVNLGEDRILWGTDSIWYGSPQDQISAFRTFQIPQSMQDEFGYPALTDAIRAKILGLSAAQVYGIDADATRCAIGGDDVSLAKAAIEADPSLKRSSYRKQGPQTRREFLRYLKLHEGRPG
ncbi:MAG: amidohydrolase [Myxococcales bacterium]|nr:amidohydrolase [Myxococcales bacterium]MDH3483275.1 amidohydrolase [Myxococcales bacterium]